MRQLDTLKKEEIRIACCMLYIKNTVNDTVAQSDLRDFSTHLVYP